MTKESESWQVEVKGEIFQTSFEELTQWIGEGAVLREDKVRRGNLRWLEAGRIPTLVCFFNAKDLHVRSDVFTSTSSQQIDSPSVSASLPKTQNYDIQEPFDNQDDFEIECTEDESANSSIKGFHAAIDQTSCINHQEYASEFICESCANCFCGTCPKRYGGTVWTCPLCGSLCKKISEVQAEQTQNLRYKNDVAGGFGFGDFGEAIGYPFRFKVSLIAGGIMFAFFSLGQSAGKVGGIVMFCAAIFCIMLSNMLTFGILANTVENFSQGKVGGNFMPSFDNFELWNDVIQPFFLSIGVYLVSFGLLVVILIGGALYVASSVKDTLKSQATTVLSPGELADLNAAKSFPGIKDATEQIVNDDIYANGELPDEAKIVEQQSAVNREEAEFQKLQSMIENHRKGQVEAITGPSEEAQKTAYSEMLKNIVSKAVPLLILAIVALGWAFFYFPAACLVAGYTRSFSATLNPMIGLDTIRRLGSDYFKILLMGFLLIVFSVITSAIIATVFMPFNMPMMGNFPAIFVSSFVTFYISTVFSVLLGFAMYKNSHKFNIFVR